MDAPNTLTLLAQFDYAGTEILDFSGSVNPIPGCAPELNILESCPVPYNPAEFAPGVERTVSASVPLLGQISQIKVPGGRVALGTGVIDTVVLAIDSITNPLAPDTTFGPAFLSNAAILLAADTALTGGNAGFPTLNDAGVPFVYIDHTVRNNFRYFYAVTAFDINSFQSGPSNLESPRITKAVTPTVSATNANFAVATTQEVWGRGVQRTDNATPAIDAATGIFSKPFPPANGWDAAFSGYVSQLVKGEGTVVIRLDSIQPGSAYSGTAGVPGTHYLTIQPGLPSESQVAFVLNQDPTSVTNTVTANFAGASVDPAQAQNFGVATDFVLGASVTATMPGGYYMSVLGRGCVNGADGFTNAAGDNECSYNGARWFVGPSPASNETTAHPTAGNMEVNNFGTLPAVLPSFNNAGALPGVINVYEPRGYLTVQSLYRQVEGVIGHAGRAADFNVYWGAGGLVDSVIDVTHNVVVPFDTATRGGWGILNASNSADALSRDTRPAVLSLYDYGCVEPLRSTDVAGGDGGILECGTGNGALHVHGPVFKLSNTAELSPLALIAGPTFAAAVAQPAQANPGFSMYLPGHIFFFETTALPAAGTVWTMRSYTGGAITGGQGQAGDEGPYAYTQVEARPFTALGAELHLGFNATNELLATTEANLDLVHTVPDPYYVTSEFEQTTDNKVIKFVNLPSAATIRIYSSSGVLVSVLEHNTAQANGSATWNVRNRNNQVVASGVYFYHVESGDARRVGRFTIVNFAQ